MIDPSVLLAGKKAGLGYLHDLNSDGTIDMKDITLMKTAKLALDKANSISEGIVITDK